MSNDPVKPRDKAKEEEKKSGNPLIEPLSDRALENVSGGLDEISSICSWLGCSG